MQIIKTSTFIFLFFITSTISFAQLLWTLDLESGFFINRNFGISEQAWGANLNGNVEYRIKADNRLALFNLRAKPELYDIGDKLMSVKLKASAEYYQFNENLSWALKINGNKFNYDLSERNYQSNSVFLVGEVSTKLFGDDRTSFKAGYSNRNVDAGDEITMDLVFADVMQSKKFSQEFNLDYGFYIEKFMAKSTVRTQFAINSSTKGLRYGPQISLSINSDFIIRTAYNFLIHESEEIVSFSSEHQVSFILGKNIFNGFSLLAYLTYYSSSLKYDETSDMERLYFQSDYENIIYLKLSYDLSDKVELYLKPGYRKIELSHQSDIIEEWHLLLGLGVSM